MPISFKFKWLILGLYSLAVACPGWSQVAVNTTGAAADASAMLDISSTTKGFLPPRMTTAQRDAIVSPAEGLMIFNTTTQTLDLCDGSSWATPRGGFICGISKVQDIDSNVYHTVEIGSQCWLASNLTTGTRIDVSESASDNGTIEKYCYDDLESNCEEYGGLYRWDEAMQYRTIEGVQGICPSGWRIPSVAEAETLIAYLGGTSAAGDAMKESGSDHWCAANSGTNSSGFAALGGGLVDPPNAFVELKYRGMFWTSGSSLHEAIRYAKFIFLECNASSAVTDQVYTTYGFSVRCIKIEN